MDVDERGVRLLRTLRSFGIEGRIVEVNEGSTWTVYETKIEAGVKVSKIKALASDLELNLPARCVRISTIPSKGVIGIEVANEEAQTVDFQPLLSVDTSHIIPFHLGRNALNEPVSIDLTKAPHLLIGGATGSGKSVCMNNLICSIIGCCSPNEVGMVLVDPKRVELSIYEDCRHVIGNVITDFEETIDMLESLSREMDRRYEKLRVWKVRNIEEYNRKAVDRMKYIVLIMDEFADFMTFGSKVLEPLIARLTSMARAVGIHVVLATQRPSVNVVTGLIKANIPSRISFQTASAVDSRIILDMKGAEKLLGKGDMLLSMCGENEPIRIQGAYMDYDALDSFLKYAPRK